MDVSPAGLALILEFEAFVPYLYNDPANATVGIGILVHLGPYHEARGECALCDEWPRQSDPESAWLTEAQGLVFLDDKAHGRGRFAGGQNYVGAVEASFPNVNQNQFDAMVSFAYNLGSGAVPKIASVFNSGGDVCAALSHYVFGVGNPTPLGGLIRRRERECELFNSPVEDEMWQRLNGVASWWENRAVAPGRGTMRIDLDFPHVPASAKAIDLEVFLDPASTGTLIFYDGDGTHYAGQVNPQRRQAVIRVVPVDRGCVFSASGDVKTQIVGIVGYVS